MAGWFELTKSEANGQFSFALKAGNGEPILRSEQYTTKAAAMNGMSLCAKIALKRRVLRN